MEIDSLAGTSCGSLSPKNHHGCQDVGYGITSYGVSCPGIQNWKKCIKINATKDNIEF